MNVIDRVLNRGTKLSRAFFRETKLWKAATKKLRAFHLNSERHGKK